MREVAAALKTSAQETGTPTRPIIVDSEAIPLLGEFDSTVLADALKSISLGAIRMITNNAPDQSLQILMRDEAVETRRQGVIEWRVSDSSDQDPFHSFAGSDAIRMSLAAKAIEAHGGLAARQNGSLLVRLPLAP
jgi:hypothetical protein